MLKIYYMSKPHETGPQQAVTFAEFLDVIGQPGAELPTVAAHPYDTSTERPFHEPFGPEVIDVRRLNKGGVSQAELPPGSLIRGTFGFWVSAPGYMVLAEAVTDKMLSTIYPRDGQYSELIAQMPLLSGSFSYETFQDRASRLGLLRFIADIRVDESRVAPDWHGYTIETVYALERPHEEGAESVPAGQSVVLEGYVNSYYEQQRDIVPNEPDPHITLATAHGFQTVWLEPLNRLPFNSASYKVNYTQPNPEQPVAGDLVQVRCYSREAGDYRIGADRSAGSRELKQIKTLHLVEAGRERWEQANRRTNEFEQALHNMLTAEDNAAFRRHYGEFLWARMDTTNYNDQNALIMTIAERQKLAEVYAAQADPEQLPLGITVSNHLAYRVQEKYGINIFGATVGEWERVVHEVISGERQPIVEDIWGSPLIDATIEANLASLPDVAEKALTVMLPRVLTNVQQGLGISNHDQAIVLDALSYSVKHGMAETHIPYVVMHAVSQIFDGSLPDSLSLYHMRMTTTDYLRRVLESCCSFSRGQAAHLNEVRRITNPELAKTIVAWMPAVLERSTAYIEAKQREYDAMEPGFEKLAWVGPPTKYQGYLNLARNRFHILERQLTIESV